MSNKQEAEQGTLRPRLTDEAGREAIRQVMSWLDPTQGSPHGPVDVDVAPTGESPLRVVYRGVQTAELIDQFRREYLRRMSPGEEKSE